MICPIVDLLGIFKSPEQVNYWTNHYDWQAVVQLADFIKYAMTPKTFEKIKCPTFLGYYYEDEDHQDKVVSVAAMKEMFLQLGTPENKKREVDFKNAHEHVIASDLISDDWKGVETETLKFLNEIVK